MLEKLLKKIENSYIKFLESEVKEVKEENFSFSFSIAKIPNKNNENKIDDFQRELIKIRDKNKGIKLITKNTTKGTIIEAIEFDNKENYLKFIGKTNDYKIFIKILKQLIRHLPILVFSEYGDETWIENNLLMLKKYNGKWGDIIKVVNYFLKDHINYKQYFYRELPVKVHTKFIENNKPIIENILNSIDFENGSFSLEKKTFEQKYNIKTKPEFIRFRFLDYDLRQKYFKVNIDDIYLKTEDFSDFKIKTKLKVFIIENEINYLTFPKNKNSIVIWGAGFNVGKLKEISWLRNIEIFYWGDLDSHGFKILAQCRKYFPQTKSILMNEKTYKEFSKYSVEGKIISESELENLEKYLNNDEFKLLQYFNKNKLRLEQENINLDFIIKNI